MMVQRFGYDLATKQQQYYKHKVSAKLAFQVGEGNGTPL